MPPDVTVPLSYFSYKCEEQYEEKMCQWQKGEKMTIFWRGIEDIGEQIGARFRKKEKGACLRKIYEQIKDFSGY